MCLALFKFLIKIYKCGYLGIHLATNMASEEILLNTAAFRVVHNYNVKFIIAYQ